MSLVCLSEASAAERSSEYFPLPQGLYSDGETCGAAEIKRNPMWNGFGVRGVIGSICQLEHVAGVGSLYRFSSTCSEGNGSAAHSWKVHSQIEVTGSDAFFFDGKTYSYCGKNQTAGTSNYQHHGDEHLPLVAGLYYSSGEKCGALGYWDNPNGGGFSAAMFGGPDSVGDLCSVTRARTAGTKLDFALTCVPSDENKLMMISVPVRINALTHSTFIYKNKMYSLCKQIIY